jgi:hypothetical protein
VALGGRTALHGVFYIYFELDTILKAILIHNTLLSSLQFSCDDIVEWELAQSTPTDVTRSAEDPF